MKTKLILTIFGIALFASSCKKEEEAAITRDDYFGTYMKSSVCEGTYPGTSSSTITISAGQAENQISIYNFTNNYETFPATVNGSEITFEDDGGNPGTGSLSGNVLTIVIDYGGTVCTSTCTRQ